MQLIIYKTVGHKRMKPKYTYKKSSEFIDNIDFEYFETYSLLRGQKFEEEIESLESEFTNIKSKTDRNEAQKRRLSELDELLNFTQVIINKKGQLHFSAEKINRIEKTDSKSERLIEILKTEINDIPNWMCAPIYRDAILFYDKNDNLIKPLNICLSCEYMETELFDHINADFKTYELMRKFLIDIGHKVETEKARC
ncbi:hypothetical protein [Psychroserpens luteus]|uniref:Uncharacterized protein n=1 Tax=Psychroserpens luteus TaxID=1434066 RepID=A0ABW5ZQP7_9FLAO|nr:hypothetical protein [Psychroserpens luteus]